MSEDLSERVARLEKKVLALMSHMEDIEDSLDAHVALQEFKESGAVGITLKEMPEQIQGLSGEELAEMLLQDGPVYVQPPEPSKHEDETGGAQ